MIFAGLQQFLQDYPEMAFRPMTAAGNLIIEGRFAFTARPGAGLEITDAFALLIEVPPAFPRLLPRVTETDGRIPRNGEYHVNPDATLCLGSPLRLILKVSEHPTLSGFAETCIVPYLYAISHKLKFGGPLPFSELAHGTPGEIQDYVDLFSLQRPEQALRTLRMLGMKKRVANKLPCPCECGRRLGKCRLNRMIGKFRKLTDRHWFKVSL